MRSVVFAASCALMMFGTACGTRSASLGESGSSGSGATGTDSEDGEEEGDADGEHDGDESSPVDAYQPVVPPYEEPELDCASPPISTVGDPQLLGHGVTSVTGKSFWDPVDHRILVFGGLRGSGDYSNEVLEIDASAAAMRTLGWQQGPSFEFTDATGGYDPVTHRWFLPGGNHGGPEHTQVLAVEVGGENDMRGESLPEMPNPIWDHTSAYDPVGHRIVFTSGWQGVSPSGYQDSTWALELNEYPHEWQELVGAGGPPGQREADMIWVPGIGLLLLAYFDEDNSDDRGLWKMETGSETWEELDVDDPLSARYWGHLLWDEASCTAVVWDEGLTAEPEIMGQAWAVDVFSDPATATPIQRPAYDGTTLFGRNLVIDPELRQIIAHGGVDYTDIDSEYSARVVAYPTF